MNSCRKIKVFTNLNGLERLRGEGAGGHLLDEPLQLSVASVDDPGGGERHPSGGPREQHQQHQQPALHFARRKGFKAGRRRSNYRGGRRALIAAAEHTSRHLLASVCNRKKSFQYAACIVSLSILSQEREKEGGRVAWAIYMGYLSGLRPFSLRI
jgi:hypothetical protein